MPRLALGLALTGTLLLAGVCGAEAQGVRAVMQACSAERQALCGSVAPGGGQILRCLREHAAQTSAACGQALQETPQIAVAPAYAPPAALPAQNGYPATPSGAGGGVRFILQACASEHQRFCGDVAPGGGRILGCLREHVAQASPECGQALQAAPTAMVQPATAVPSQPPGALAPASASPGTSGGQLGANLPTYSPSGTTAPGSR